MQFIPQCAAVAFAGDLAYSASFVVNAASGGVYTFVIDNPNYSVQGQSWEALQAAGVLQDISVHYKPSAGNDALWQTVPSSQPIAPLSAPLTQDYYAFYANLQQLSSQYDFRVVAQCAQPAQVVDASLYKTISSVVTATVDLTGPNVVAYEPAVPTSAMAPAQNPPNGQPPPGTLIPVYMPGDVISVSFDEPISCTGTAGPLHYLSL